MKPETNHPQPVAQDLTKRRFGFTRPRALIFALVFANIGVGALLFSSAATTSAPNPTSNIVSSSYPQCFERTLSCNQQMIKDLNYARHVMGKAPYNLPDNFYSLSEKDQLYTVINLDRASYGIPAVKGYNATLNSYAQGGITSGNDPTFPARVNGYALQMGGSNWAGPFDNILSAYYSWMFNDGLNSGNLDCTSSNRTGCWGHRENILINDSRFNFYIGMGTGQGPAKWGTGESYTTEIDGFAPTAVIPHYGITNPVILPPKIAYGDIEGTGKSDIVAIQSNGTLWIYHNSGSATSPFGNRVLLSTSSTWTTYNRILLADTNGDGKADLIATKADGTLWEYLNTGSATAPFADAHQIGSGWQIFSKLFAGDMDGTHRANLLGVDSSGNLWEYTNTGVATSPYSSASTAYKHQIGTGWDGFSSLAAGDLNGDGRADVIGVNGAGAMYYYRNTGSNASPVSSATGFKTEISSGWGVYNTFLLGDLNSDGKAELVTVKPDGTLWEYINSSSLNSIQLGTAHQIGSSWNTYAP